MQQPTRYFQILELDSCESLPVLKSAYRRELHKWHPDHHMQDPVMLQTATERTRQINEAYDFLSKKFEFGAENDMPQATRHPGRTKPSDPPSFVPGFPDSAVEECFIKSSMILSAGYNDREGILYLKFRDQTVYGYYGVPNTVYWAFMQADSHGRFAHRHIYNNYRTERFS